MTDEASRMACMRQGESVPAPLAVSGGGVWGEGDMRAKAKSDEAIDSASGSVGSESDAVVSAVDAPSRVGERDSELTGGSSPELVTSRSSAGVCKMTEVSMCNERPTSIRPAASTVNESSEADGGGGEAEEGGGGGGGARGMTRSREW